MKKLIVILVVLLFSSPAFSFDWSEKRTERKQRQHQAQVEESMLRQEKQLQQISDNQDRQEWQRRSRERQKEAAERMRDALKNDWLND